MFLHFWYFLYSDFAPASGSPASVSDHVMTSQDYRNVEHLETEFACSNFPPATFVFFRLTFSYFGAVVYTSSFLDAVVCSG